MTLASKWKSEEFDRLGKGGLHYSSMPSILTVRQRPQRLYAQNIISDGSLETEENLVSGFKPAHIRIILSTDTWKGRRFPVFNFHSGLPSVRRDLRKKILFLSSCIHIFDFQKLNHVTSSNHRRTVILNLKLMATAPAACLGLDIHHKSLLLYHLQSVLYWDDMAFGIYIEVLHLFSWKQQ